MLPFCIPANRFTDTFDLHSNKSKDELTTRVKHGEPESLGEEEEDQYEEENVEEEDDDGADALSSSPSIPDDVGFTILIGFLSLSHLVGN